MRLRLARTAVLAASTVGATTGATWTSHYSVPGTSDLFSVSCPTPRDCVAVGGDDGVIFRTVDRGSTWVREEVPRGTPTLTSVSCPTTSFCMAISPYFSNDAHAAFPVTGA
jgi:photosystem II stability/assembly factor-like uncharacterized protein